MPLFRLNVSKSLLKKKKKAVWRWNILIKHTIYTFFLFLPCSQVSRRMYDASAHWGIAVVQETNFPFP